MATGGIVTYDPATGAYTLPPEHAICLTGDRVENLAAMAWLCVVLGRHVPAVADAFRAGSGVPYADYLPELHDVMEAVWGPGYDHLLVDHVLPLAPGLPERLRAGARVADVCCGTGRAVMTLAAAFPDSRFVGFDLDATAIARARDRAADLRLANAAFEVCDAAALPAGQPFDAVLVFNAIHDQAAPARVLRRMHDALIPGGTVLMNEPALSARLEDNLDDPMAPFVYAVSTLHCLTVSLAAGGAGLGTAWGWQVACDMLAEAGFADVARHDTPGEPGNAVFVARRP
jgi:SAM-dependent methyltransferase